MGHRRVTVFAEHHEMFRATVRAFVEREVAPHVEAWEAAGRIPKSIWQLHGGYGYMREYAIERFARDARLFTIGGGTSEIMKEIIAKELKL